MSNRAAVYNGNTKAPFYEIKNLAIPKVPKDAILVKAVAYAANPTDWIHLTSKVGPVGAVLGCDVSGVIEDVGSDVKGFAKGDYVSTWLHGSFEKDIGAFQDYVVSDPLMTIKYDKSNFKTEPLPVGDSPSGLIDTFEGAASIPLGLSTVAYSLSNQLKLKQNDPSNKKNYIMIWGGATATGVLAIQVAKHVYGLNVIATASSKNKEFLKSLGADYVVDYNDKDAIEQIRAIGGGKIYYAFDTISVKKTYQAVYDATSETTDGLVRIDNLLMLGEESLTLDKSRTNVKLGKTLVYVVNGKPTNVGFEEDFYPDADLVDDYKDFWYNILPSFLPKLKHNNLKVLEPGLESAGEAIALLLEKKVSGEKVVFRAK